MNTIILIATLVCIKPLRNFFFYPYRENKLQISCPNANFRDHLTKFSIFFRNHLTKLERVSSWLIDKIWSFIPQVINEIRRFISWAMDEIDGFIWGSIDEICRFFHDYFYEICNRLRKLRNNWQIMLIRGRIACPYLVSASKDMSE